MNAATIRLPFTLIDAYHGFAEGGGLIFLQKDKLCIEVQVKDAFFGAIKSGVKEYRIPLVEIIDIAYKRNMFLSRLNLRVSSLKWLDAFPGAKDSEIKLKIKRKDKELVLHLVSHIKLRISELRLEELDDDPFI